MRRSLVAFSLLLAVLGPAAIALGPAAGRTGMAADLAPGEMPQTACFGNACHGYWTASWRWHQIRLAQQNRAASDQRFDWGNLLDVADAEEDLAGLDSRTDEEFTQEMSAKEYYYAYVFPQPTERYSQPSERGEIDSAAQDEQLSKEYYYTYVYPERCAADNLTESYYNAYAGETYDSTPYETAYDANDAEGESSEAGYAIAEDNVRGAGAEAAVLDALVSWMSGSLEGVGDAFHGLSRRVAGLRREPVTVGSRADHLVN